MKELARKGVGEMEGPGGEVVNLASLRVHTLFVAQPQISHTFRFTFSYRELPTEDEQVEAEHTCSHQFLRCEETGVVVDFSFGQFTGGRDFPHFFASVDELEARVRAEGFDFIHSEQCPQDEVVEQMDRDKITARAHRRQVPGKNFDKFAEQAAANMLGGWENICIECDGTSENLKRCARCKAVLYCGVLCQGRHWKREHKKCCGTASAASDVDVDNGDA